MTQQYFDEYLRTRITLGSINIESCKRIYRVDNQSLQDRLSQEGFEPSPTDHKTWIIPRVGTEPVKLEVIDSYDCLIVTSYTCGTEVNKAVWKSILSYAELVKGKVIVIPQRYRNPSNLEEAMKGEEDIHIDPLVRPYLMADRLDYGNFRILGDVRINPTAINPFTGLEALSYGYHVVVPHNTYHLQSLPRMYPAPPRFMTTTGSVSILPPPLTLAGKRCEHDHRYGFVHVRKDWFTHCHSNTSGTFYSQGAQYGPDGYKGQVSPLCSFWGDIHFGQHDHEAVRWAIEHSLEIQPELVVLNDSFDGETVNHHDKRGWHRFRNFSSVSAEVSYHRKMVQEIQTKTKRDVMILDSNHSHFLSRWASEGRSDQARCLEDIKLMSIVLVKGYQSVLYRDCDYSMGGYMIEKTALYHGHEGFSGAKASLKGKVKLPYRTVSGHTHSPASFRGHDVAGCLCKIDAEYTRGSFTTWAHSLVDIYPSGKVEHVIKFE